jgi:hypothetical protein
MSTMLLLELLMTTIPCQYITIWLFVRGTTECMFENIYALTNNYSQNTTFALDTPVSAAFDVTDLSATVLFKNTLLAV